MCSIWRRWRRSPGRTPSSRRSACPFHASRSRSIRTDFAFEENTSDRVRTRFACSWRFRLNDSGASDVIGGYNSYVSSLKEGMVTDCRLATILLAESDKSLFVDKPLSDVENMSSKVSFPGGGTTLFDAPGADQRCPGRAGGFAGKGS